MIGQALGSEFRDVSDQLFVDRALAVQVPYPRPDHPIASTTISTAHEAGWTWDIGLNNRRGVGYVYSSRHTDDARAEEVLRAYIGPAAEGLTPRQLKFRLGWRDRMWVKNCVAVGLSAGFLEPLESTGIVMIGAAADTIADVLPRNSDGFEAAASFFNRGLVERFERSTDFLKLHYCLTRRTDHPFWIDNADPKTWSDRLLDQVTMWKNRPPSVYDFFTTHESFAPASWQFILYGMGFKTDLSARAGAYGRVEEAQREFQRMQMLNQAIQQQLPDHRALIDEVYAHGFRPKQQRPLAAAQAR
jgi:tryptophan halogenase